MMKEQTELQETELVATSQKDFQIMRWIAGGGFGQVYLGKWNNKEVAIKHLTNVNEAAKNEFLSEVRIMWKYSYHPKLVQLLSVCMEQSYYAMILEYMDNGTLHNLLSNQNQKLPWKKKYQIILDISEGLKFLHDNQIVHGDIKTDNVLFDKNWTAKIADFGGSKIKLYGSNVSITIEGRKVGGTLNYLAPELLENLEQSIFGFSFKPGTKTNYASDLYSYGMVLWAITTRREPFLHIACGNFADFKKIILDFRMGEILNPETPPELKKTIETCWKFDPNQRPKIAETFSKIISECKGLMGKKEVVKTVKRENANLKAEIQKLKETKENMEKTYQAEIEALELKISKLTENSVARPQQKINPAQTPLSIFGSPKPVAKKQLTAAEQTRQNDFVEAILEADLEKVKLLHKEGALLTEPDQNQMYPLVAAAYSTSMETLKYIEGQLGREAEQYWAKVDRNEAEQRVKEEMPEKRPEGARIGWLADWFRHNQTKRWTRNYDKQVTADEMPTRWAYEYWFIRGRNIAYLIQEELDMGGSDDTWSDISVLQRAYNDDRSHPQQDLIHEELVWPSPSTHDKVVKEITESLNQFSQYVESKVAQYNPGAKLK